MAQRLVLHVGLMKSGTSYLQSVLEVQQEALAAADVLLPAGPPNVQARAVTNRVASEEGAASRNWRRLVDDVRRAPGTAVVSTELLGPVRTVVARELVRELVEETGTPEVRVVLTVRDLNRVLPSMWQETIQNGRTWSWADYVADIAARRPGRGEVPTDRTLACGSFWRQQDVVGLVQGWAGLVGSEHVRLVTVPAPGAPRTALLDRFVEATGLPLPTPERVPVANEALGLPSTLVLLRVNQLLADRGIPFRPGAGFRKRVLAKTVLGTRRGEEPVLGLPVPDWVRDQTERTLTELRRTGVEVVGDLADLEPVDVAGVQPEDVAAADVAEAAAVALSGLVARHVAQSAKAQSKTGTQTIEDDDTA